MAKSRKKKRPPGGPDTPLKDDGAALDGWWVLGRVSRLLQIDWDTGSMWVYHLGADFEWRTWITFDLGDGGGNRLIVYLEDHDRPETKTPAFEYRLDGDRLELTQVPGADWHEGKRIWELTGAWFRLRFPEDAEPGGAPDRRGT